MRAFLSRNWTWLVGLLGAILLAAVVFAVWRSVPPNHLTILTGRAGGAYHTAALEYQKIAAEKGFELELIDTAGSPEVLQRLRAGDAGIGFVQGGVATAEDAATLSTMASVFYEPLWFFYRRDAWDGVPVTEYQQLAGKRVSVGELNSGTSVLAGLILNETAVTSATADLVNLSTADAIEALRDGSIDGAFAVMGPRAARIRDFFSVPGIALMDVARAKGYAARHPYLAALTLHAGTIDPAQNLPPQDVQLVSTVANLVVRNDFHPDLLRLMTIAAVRTHEIGGIFEERFEFPNLLYADLPISEETVAYLESVKQGNSVLDNYFPFRIAAVIDRYMLLFLPVLLLLVPILARSPLVFQFFMRQRIYRWYRQVHAIEAKADYLNPRQVDAELERLDELDERLSQMSVPLFYMPLVYDLRLHISQVQERLERRKIKGDATLKGSAAAGSSAVERVGADSSKQPDALAPDQPPDSPAQPLPAA